ncbi:MAG: MBL fold metallo-hydrolase [Chloroflexi bacterium]|nr:MBL fold metallo-hydrolase [Chloroflexota bacterium]
MVARLRTSRGMDVYALGVPQSWDSHTGPTWCYLCEADVLTLVDTGKYASLPHLEKALEATGYRTQDIQRIILTHGHADHDGNAYPLQQASGAELLCHEVYAHSLNVDPYVTPQMMGQPQLVPHRDAPWEWEEAHQAYHRTRAMLKVTKAVADGDTAGPFTFLYTPGHAMDGLCTLLDGVMFSGDHILPDITPHPSCCAYYEHFRPSLPPTFRNENQCFGLRTYLKSVRKVGSLDHDYLVLPAHRLFRKGRWWLHGRERAGQILDHHLHRLSHIARLATNPDSLFGITRRLFNPSLLTGWGFFSGYTELLSHVEFLAETGDVEYVEKETVRWRGTTNYQDAIRQLAPVPNHIQRP